MGDIVNLKTMRKRKARETRENAAEASRIKHGLTKAEKHLAQKEARRAEKFLDGHHIVEDT